VEIIDGDKVYAVSVAEKTGPTYIASVLQNPLIIPARKVDEVYETSSKFITIEGDGFTTIADTKITLYPTKDNAFTIVDVQENMIRLQLQPHQSWIPSIAGESSYDGEDGKVSLQIRSIDTGAGPIVFRQPTTIGMIMKDKATEPTGNFHYNLIMLPLTLVIFIVILKIFWKN
jgi:hypothetical protein